MLTIQDRKWLEGSTGKRTSILRGIYFVMSILLFVCAALNLHLAARWGDMQGHSLADLLRGWIAGTQVGLQYSGIYIKAMDRIQMSVLEFGFSLIWFLVGALSIPLMQNRQRRILETLKQHGAW